MNIWLLQGSEPKPIVNNGERLFRMGMIAEELNRRNHHIIWFTSTFDHFRKKQLSKKNKIINVKGNYYIYLLHAKGYKKNISISRIINHKVIALKFMKVSKKMDKPDLIYASFPTIDFAEAAIKYGKKHNVPVIVDIRDLWPDIFKHNLKGIKQKVVTPYIKLLDYKTKKIMANAYAINSISDAMLNWGLEKGKRQKSIIDKYFFIGYDKTESPKIENKDIININKFNISFFATINNQFDYDRIIELAKLLDKKDKDIVINICGDGPQFKTLKEKCKDINNINLLGWTNRNTLSYILDNSKIGFAPYKDTFDFQMSVSNKFAEYISYGLPVIITSGGYMKELLKNNNCGFSTHNMNKMCNYIIDLKNNNYKYKEVSQNATNLYNREFIARDIYYNLVDYLENIIKENV